MAEEKNEKKLSLMNQENTNQEIQTESSQIKSDIQKRRGLSRFFYVEVVLTLYFLSDFPLNLIMQRYTLDWTAQQILTQDDTFNNITHFLNQSVSPCSVNVSEELRRYNEQVQSTSSMISAVQSVVRGVVPAVFSTLILGAASDRFGRRYAVLPACCGVFVYSLAVLIVTFFRLPVYYAFIGDFLYGCTGLMQGLVTGCFGYLTDIIPLEKRTVRFSRTGACAFVPILISSFGVGFLESRLGYWKTVLVFAIFLIANLLYVAIFMPKMQKKAEGARSSFFKPIRSQIFAGLSLMCKKDEAGTRYTSICFTLLLSTMFFISLSSADNVVSYYFVMNSPLCWDLKLIGWFNCVSMITSALGFMVILPLQKKCLSESIIAIKATLCGALVCFYKFFVTTTWMMFIVPVVGLFVLQSIPCVRTMISEVAGKHRQGAVFGILSSVEVICGMMGTTLFNSVYSSTLHISSGFVFIIVALIYMIATFLLTILYVIQKRQASQKCSDVQEQNEILEYKQNPPINAAATE